MSKYAKLLSKMRDAPGDMRYEELKNLCVRFFGPPRQDGSSHAVFKTPWRGDPRVNIQAGKNDKAKEYQVRQVLAAIDRLSLEDEERSSQ